jgi:outer membrane protein OmpA-like peptidoglycan-associated protein
LACAALADGAAHGQTAPNAPLSGPYVSLGAGVDIQPDTIREAAPNLQLPHARFFQFDPGLAAQFGVGWGFGNGLRLDFDVPFLLNQVRGTTGYATPHRAGGTEVKYGGLVNLIYDFNLGLPVTPYLGLGAGGVEIEHDGFNFSSVGFSFPHPPNGSQVGGDFAYQGIVGLSYPVPAVPGLAMTAEYRFLGVADPGPGYRTTVFNGAGDVIGNGTVHYSNDFDHSLMVGLRYALFQPRPPVQGPEAAPPEAPAPAPMPTRTYLVFFDWDRADLTARARQIIAEAATASSQVQTTQIDVNGYTDSSGSAAYNRRLSVRRAESVAAELVRDGISADDIVMKGFGETNPLVPTAKGVREPQNRRVEIILQ